MRVKLATRGSGRWQSSGGFRSKFGLTASELIKGLELLASRGMEDCLQLLHFHQGSQITNIRHIKGALNEASRLLEQIQPTLPVLLANLTTVAQIGITYNASLEQLLVLLPPFIGSLHTVGLPRNNPTGYTQGDFTLTLNDPPACTVGFLPPSSWRSPSLRWLCSTATAFFLSEKRALKRSIVCGVRLISGTSTSAVRPSLRTSAMACR
jgi:hypothetical protein